MSATEASPEWCPTGSIVAGKYRLDTLLGQGGMGSVWRAFNLQLDVPVAIKLLRADLAAADLGERLRVEARAAAKLVHPSVVRVFDIGESESGDPFIVMELLNGESLGTLLERGALPPAKAIQLLLPIAEALSLAHSRGVVHRDIKPDNIFIASGANGALQPKLLDFGIAKVTSGAAGSTLTQNNTLLGSPEYMSPEQAQGLPDVDERADIWGFCVVLYEMLAGQPPFSGETVTSLLSSVLQDEPPALGTVANIDPALAAIVRSGLEKDRDARPACMFDLGRELACWLLAHGALEDATGASLESKWLGRSKGDHTPAVPGTVAPRLQHEDATLVSVVRPSALAEKALAIPLRRPQRRRWVPLAIAGGLAAIALASLGLRGASDRPESRAATVSLLAPPASTVTQARAASRSEPPSASLAAIHSEPGPEVKVVPRVKVRAVATPTRPTRGARPSVAPTASAASLPQALPAAPPPVAKKRSDLMNPY